MYNIFVVYKHIYIYIIYISFYLAYIYIFFFKVKKHILICPGFSEKWDNCLFFALHPFMLFSVCVCVCVCVHACIGDQGAGRMLGEGLWSL